MRYTCWKCEEGHAIDNVAAACVFCYAKLKAALREAEKRLASVSEAWEASKKDREFHYSGRIEAMLRAEVAEKELAQAKRCYACSKDTFDCRAQCYDCWKSIELSANKALKEG